MSNFQIKINENMFEKGRLSMAMQIKNILRTVPDSYDVIVQIDELIQEVCKNEQRKHAQGNIK
jgi:type IV secretory pathway TrbF-like protein